MAGTNNPLGKKSWFTQFTGYENNKGAIDMYDSLIAQHFAIFGLPLDYVSAEVDENKDRIFGEDTTKKYIQKHKLTSILKEGQIEETLLFNGYGQLNTVEFSMYIHINTWKLVVGADNDPKPGDHFFFPHGNSNLGFEVMHVGFSTIGLENNILGQRTTYEIVARERYVSDADEGIGEQYGLIQTVFIPESWVGDTITIVDETNTLQQIVVTEDMVGTGVTIMVNDAPDDAILPDGRIADKYIVEGANPRTNKGDDEYIEEFADGEEGADPVDDYDDNGLLYDVLKTGNVVPRDRSLWAEW
jgi:hypothetical protein